MERSAGALADAKIVAALRQGNEAGVKQLLATYQAPLLAYAFRLLADRHAAEDVVQESLMRFLDRLDDLHDPTKLRSYLYSTVTNCCRDHQRRPGRREMVATSLPQQAAAATVEEAVVDRSYVSALLQELSPTHAEVVVLRYYEDMELETIAEILGLPVGTVKSRLHYALKRLRFFSQTKAAIERAGGGLMSRKLQRMWSETGLPELDEKTAIYLEQALEDERVPRPKTAETLHLQAVLSQRLAAQTTQSNYRQLVEKERTQAAGSWAKVLGGLYEVLQLVGPQVRLITGAFWLSSAVVMSLGVMLLPAQMRLTALLLVAPLLAVMSVAYAFRSYDHGVVEWERSCPVAPGDLVLARLLLVVLYDILLSFLVSVALYASGVGESLTIIILTWLAPLLALAGITLLVSLRYGHLFAVVSGSTLWLAFALISRETLPTLSGPAISIIWCVLVVVGVGCMVAAAVHTSQWETTYVD